MSSLTKLLEADRWTLIRVGHPPPRMIALRDVQILLPDHDAEVARKTRLETLLLVKNLAYDSEHYYRDLDALIDATEREGRMAKFRKKPAVIEAVQFTADEAKRCLFETDYEKKLFCGLGVSGSYNKERDAVYDAYVMINTLEGDMRLKVGDWLITGVAGEQYPCKPDIFAATYEAVE